MVTGACGLRGAELGNIGEVGEACGDRLRSKVEIGAHGAMLSSVRIGDGRRPSPSKIDLRRLSCMELFCGDH